MANPDEKVAVVVVGGSLVGLSAAVFLAARGVPVVLLERHKGSSPHPRAIGFTTRTVEHFRSVGLDKKIPSIRGGGKPRRIEIDYLAGKWHDEKHWTQPGPAVGNGFGNGGPPNGGQGPQKGNGGPPGGGHMAGNAAVHSPVQAIAITQDRLEPILRTRATELGADLRLGCKLIGFRQDEDAVYVTAVGPDQQEFTITARYLIGCDGAKSSIREALQIPMHGVGHLRTLKSILFRCPSIEKYLDRGFVQFAIERPDFSAFLITYSDGRWALMWNDESNEPISEEFQRAKVIQAIGKEVDDLELLTLGQWELKGAVALKFQVGRVFIAGDAAHTLPPNRGGFGANTGIQDVYNLAWKIASVTWGISSEDLLDTYDEERQPVAYLRHNQIFVRDDYKDYVKGSLWESDQKDTDEGFRVIGDVEMELGTLYISAAISSGVDDPDALGLAKLPAEWAGQPGIRAPHLVIEHGGKTISTLDLFGNGWVLLSEDAAWRDVSGSILKKLPKAINSQVCPSQHRVHSSRGSTSIRDALRHQRLRGHTSPARRMHRLESGAEARTAA